MRVVQGEEDRILGGGLSFPPVREKPSPMISGRKHSAPSLQPSALAGLAVCVVAAAFLAAGCSSGDDDASETVVVPAWGTFRHDVGNTGLGSGPMADNTGEVRLLLDLSEVRFGGPTLSTPVIGSDDTLYVGAGNGLVAVSTLNGAFDHVEGFSGTCSRTGVPCGGSAPCAPGEFCACSRCETGSEAPCEPIGAVRSSPVVTGEGEVVIVSDRGLVLGMRREDSRLECRWVSRPYEAPMLSSPIVVLDAADRSVASVFVGTGNGSLVSLNRDGTQRWSLPLANGQPLTSSPALSSDGLVYTALPDGSITVVSQQGEVLRRFMAGPFPELDLLASPAVTTAVFVPRAEGSISAFNPDGVPRWTFETGAAMTGSVVIVGELIEREPTPSSTPTPQSEPTEDGTPTATPAATPTPVTVFDTVVYAVDERGTNAGPRTRSATRAGSCWRASTWRRREGTLSSVAHLRFLRISSWSSVVRRELSTLETERGHGPVIRAATGRQAVGR